MSEDRDLQKAVLAEFEWEPALTAAHIGVAADHGVVTLTGTVPHYLEKRAAESAAARVKGVKAVAEELKVHLPGTMKRNDSEIGRAAIDRLLWETTVPADSIKIKVEDGWVTLRGEVEWHYQKKAAERMVRGLIGVVGVSNMTTIKPHIDADNIRHSIDEALHRSWFDPDKVNVEADGGKVTLSGTVHTPADRYKAGLMAWAAPGATSVENDLVVAD